MIKNLVLILLFLFPVHVEAATYYVCPTTCGGSAGSDANNGTSLTTQWQHFGYATGAGSTLWHTITTGYTIANPYTKSITNFTNDLGVALTNSPFTAYVKVASGPTTGQYSVTGDGTYTFSSADANVAVTITSNTTNGTAATNNPTPIASGDTLYLRGGKFQEFGIQSANSLGANIWTSLVTIKPYPGEAPVIDGGYLAQPSDPLIGVSSATSDKLVCFELDNSFLTLGSTNGDVIAFNHCLWGGIGGGTASTHMTNDIIQYVDVGFNFAPDNGGGIYIGGDFDGGIIQNSKAHDATGTHGGLIRGNCLQIFNAGTRNNQQILNNEIYNCDTGVYYKLGVSKSGSYENNRPLVKNNKIHDIGQPGAGTQVIGIFSETDNMDIVNNLIYNMSSGGNPIGLYQNEQACDQTGTVGGTVKHNTLIQSVSGAPTLFLGHPAHCPDYKAPTPPPNSAGAVSTTITDNLIYNTASSTGGFGLLGIWSNWGHPENGGYPPLWTACHAWGGSSPNNAYIISPSAGLTSQPFDFYTFSNGVTNGSGTPCIGTEPDWTKSNQHPVSGIAVGDTITDGTITWNVISREKHLTTSDYNLVYDPNTTSVWSLYGIGYTSVATWKTATGSDYGTNSTIQDAHSIQLAPTFVNVGLNNYALANGSNGKNAADDGTDMGACIGQVGIGNGGNSSCTAVTTTTTTTTTVIGPTTTTTTISTTTTTAGSRSKTNRTKTSRIPAGPRNNPGPRTP